MYESDDDWRPVERKYKTKQTEEEINAAELDRLDQIMQEKARIKLTGNYTDDVKQLRRGRRAYWELNGESSKKSAHEKERKKPSNAENKSIDLNRVSQRLQLERQDLEAKVTQIRREFSKLAKRKIVLEEEWKKLHVDRANFDEDRRRFQAARKSQWFQSNLLPTSDMRRIRINVGGQLFETSEKVLKRDPASLLAAMVQEDSPISADESGCFVIDRDWFLFRHILGFLRDGALPPLGDSACSQLVTNLYTEAEFYNLETLRNAIREFLDPHQLVERSAAVPLSRLHKLEAKLSQSLREKFSLDNEFDDGVDRGSESGEEEEDKASDDWWSSKSYKGKRFEIETKAPPPVWRRAGNSLSTAKAKADETQPFSSTTSTWRRSGY